jgi:hypothetical protein
MDREDGVELFRRSRAAPRTNQLDISLMREMFCSSRKWSSSTSGNISAAALARAIAHSKSPRRQARWRRGSAAPMRSWNSSRCDEGCRFPIPPAGSEPSLRQTQFAIHESGEAGPIQRIAARTIDAYEFECTRRCNHEADQPSTHRTGNRSNVPLHVTPAPNQHGYPSEYRTRK